METLQRQKKLSFIDMSFEFHTFAFNLAEIVENLTDVMILKREARPGH